jgi:hypothetical protein
LRRWRSVSFPAVGAGRQRAGWSPEMTIEAVAIFAQLQFAVVEHVSWFDHVRLDESLGDIALVEFEPARAAAGRSAA